MSNKRNMPDDKIGALIRKKNTRKKMMFIGGISLIAITALAFSIIKLNNGAGTKKTSGDLKIASVSYDENEIAYGDAPGGITPLGVITKHKVTVIASPGVGGTVTDSAYVTEGSDFAIKAVPASGYYFKGWYENGTDNCISTLPEYTISGVSNDMNITAVFETKAFSITTESAVLTEGSIDSSFKVKPGGGVVTGGGMLHANSDETLTIDLKNASTDGYIFIGWLVNGEYKSALGKSESIKVMTTGATGTESYVVNEDTVFTAVFGKIAVNINISMVPSAGTINLTYDGKRISSGGSLSLSLLRDVSHAITIEAVIPDMKTTIVDTSENPPKQKTVQRYTIDYLHRINANTGLEDNLEIHPEAANSKARYSGTIDANSPDYNYVFYLKPAVAQDQAEFAAIGCAFPNEAGVVTGGGSSTMMTNYSLNAVANDGYKFDHWEWFDNGINNTSRDLILNAQPSGYVFYTAYFVPDTVSVSLSSVTPSDGGTVTGLGKYLKKDGSARVPITITPTNGYELVSWSTTTGGVSTSRNIPSFDSSANKYETVYLDLTGDTTISLNFKQKKFRITAIADPDPNTVSMKYGDSISNYASSVSNIVDDTTIVELTAKEADGYSFKRWIGSDGSMPQSSGAPDYRITVSPAKADVTYTAQFEKDLYAIGVDYDPKPANGTVTCKVNGEDRSFGTSPAPVNTVLVSGGDTVEFIGTPESGYRLAYWTNKAGEKISGSVDEATKVNTLTMTNVNWEDVFTAHFVKEEISVTVNVAPKGAGAASFNGQNPSSNSETYKVDYLSNGTLEATPSSEKYEFERWEDDKGKIYTTNPLQLINISEDITYTAVFNTKTSGFKVLASPPSGGKVTKTLSSDGKSAELKAVANRGYSFVCWKKGDAVISKNAVCTITDMTDGTVYTAYFSGGALETVEDSKSSLTTQHYYHDKRLNTSPNYKVTREGLIVGAHAMIEAEKANQYKNSVPGLKNYKAVSEAEKMYDDINIQNDRTILLNDNELITTLGEVMPTEVISDFSDEEEFVKEYVQRKFGTKYEYEILTCKKVSVPNGFTDGIRTYIWKYQNVNQNDNIFIIYEVPGKRADWVSCVIDEGNSLKFTIDSIENGCTMTIVRVRIEPNEKQLYN